MFVAGLLALASLAFPGQALAGSARESKPSPLRALIFYLPNRVLDILDVVSVGVAPPAIPYIFPSSAHANIHLTRAFQVGAGNTRGVFLGKGYGRRFAWGLEHNELSIGPLTFAEYERFQGSGAETSRVERVGMLLPTDAPFAEGMSDYWAIGAHIGLLPVAVELDVHPVELVDLLLGLLCLDIAGDDH
ncbi:MAG: hypothetical protein FJ290_26575 [Planctomycetes bacterium]|nr:hypothetical protein [Planctomycetota bacterium]